MFSPKRYAFKNIYHSKYLQSKILSEIILSNNGSFTVHWEIVFPSDDDEEEEVELQRKLFSSNTDVFSQTLS